MSVHPNYKVGKEVGKEMARSVHNLSDVKVKSAKISAGRHSDGGGLYLTVSPTGSKSWVFIWTRDGKRREMGMGAYPAVTLAKARTRAAEYREMVADGIDPIDERDRGSEPSFKDCVTEFLNSVEVQWRNEKHRAQWRSTLTAYCEPISEKKVGAVNTDDVLKILKPIWATKSETASRVRGRIERVLDYAKARGWRTGENPALWRGHLQSILPARQKLTRGHHAALPYDGVPAFVAHLRGLEATAARALELLILTAARSGEILGAKWGEIDLNSTVWTVPRERMKAGRVHRVPLCKTAVTLLEKQHEARISDYVFPGHKKDRPLSVMAMTMLMRRMKFGDYTVHGFRSAFRDWAGDATSFPREVAEAALAHAVGDETERAYRRSDALEKRRKLMDEWETFVSRPAKTSQDNEDAV